MKAFYTLVGILLLVVMFTTSTVGQSPNTCNRILINNKDKEDYLRNQPELAYLSEWHNEDWCGDGITLGVFVDYRPSPDAVQGLVDASLLAIEGVEEYEDDRELSLDILTAIHTIAPHAKIVVYATGNDIRYQTFEDGIRAMGDVDIFVNTIAPIVFPPSDIAPTHALMRQQAFAGKIWLNSAGNLGNSYYSGTFSTTPVHTTPFEGGLLPIFVTANTNNAYIILISKDVQANYTVQAWTNSAVENREAIPFVGENYADAIFKVHLLPPFANDTVIYVQFFNSTSPNISLTNRDFEFFVLNAVIDRQTASGGNSIPGPNACCEGADGVFVVGANLPSETTQKIISSAWSLKQMPHIWSVGKLSETGQLRSGIATAVVAGMSALQWEAHSGNGQQAIIKAVASGDLLPTRENESTPTIAIGDVLFIDSRLLVFLVIVVFMIVIMIIFYNLGVNDLRRDLQNYPNITGNKVTGDETEDEKPFFGIIMNLNDIQRRNRFMTISAVGVLYQWHVSITLNPQLPNDLTIDSSQPIVEKIKKITWLNRLFYVLKFFTVFLKSVVEFLEFLLDALVNLFSQLSKGHDKQSKKPDTKTYSLTLPIESNEIEFWLDMRKLPNDTMAKGMVTLNLKHPNILDATFIEIAIYAKNRITGHEPLLVKQTVHAESLHSSKR